MAPTEHTTVILPVNLGDASNYDGAVFPLAYHDTGNAIVKGSLLLSATLDEMIKIAEMGIDLNTDKRFRFNARIQYEVLTAKETKLQSSTKSLNPFTMFRHYRAARMFHAASKALYLETKRTSERIQREEKLVRTVPSTEMHTMDGKAPQGATIGGIEVTLPGPLDDDAKRKILAAANAIASHANASNPFIDNPHIEQWSDDDSIITLADTASLLSLDETSSAPHIVEPMSPNSVAYHFNLVNCVMAVDSNVNTATLDHNSKNSSGSTQQPPP